MRRIFPLAVAIVFVHAQMPILAQHHNPSAAKHRIDRVGKGKDPSAVLLEEVQKPKENVQNVLTLIRSGANLEQHDVVAGVRYYTPLQYAASLHHWKTVRVLVARGANPNPSAPFGDEHYQTPLMHCAQAGQSAIVKLLIRHGADVNAKGYHDLTALMLAAESGHKDIVITLLKSGADVSATTYFSHETALDIAKYENHKEIVKLLQRYRKH